MLFYIYMCVSFFLFYFSTITLRVFDFVLHQSPQQVPTLTRRFLYRLLSYVPLSRKKSIALLQYKHQSSSPSRVLFDFLSHIILYRKILFRRIFRHFRIPTPRPLAAKCLIILIVFLPVRLYVKLKIIMYIVLCYVRGQSVCAQSYQINMKNSIIQMTISMA